MKEIRGSFYFLLSETVDRTDAVTKKREMNMNLKLGNRRNQRRKMRDGEKEERDEIEV